MIKYRDPEKFREGDISRMNQPFEPKGPEQDGKKVSCCSENSPEGVNTFQKSKEVFDRNLGKQEDNDSYGDEDRNEKTLQK